MPTIFTHAAVAVALGKLYTPKPMPWLFWQLSVGLAMLPDLDVIAFKYQVPYSSPWGHRGLSHSLTFALCAGLLAGSLTYRLFGANWWTLVNYFFVVTASHGVLDAFTNGGEGVAFFAPFSDDRYFFPWRPIEVSHIGLSFFSNGSRTMLSEILWIWLPTALFTGVVLWRRRRRQAHQALDGSSPPSAS